MSGQAYGQRLLKRAGEGSDPAGGAVSVALDRVVISGVHAPESLLATRRAGRPWNPDHVLLTMDFHAPEVEPRVPRSRAVCRETAEAFGLRHVLDLNRGIGSHVVIEEALVTPGQVVAGCGRCLGVLGAVGSLGVTLDPEALAGAVVSGRLELPGAPSAQVAVRGRLPRWAGPWDVAAAVSARFGHELAGTLVEFTGEVEEWPVDLRIGVCGLLTEMGAWAALFQPDETVVRFYRERGVPVPATTVEAGGDAYRNSIELDVGGLRALQAREYAGPYTAISGEGDEVQGVFIGSCYGGRYEDLARVAEVLKRTGQVAPGVRLAVSPATLETARASLAAGFTEIFLEAGAMVIVPGGGAGSTAIFGDGERIVSTGEYHRQLDPGQGVPDVHIVGPAAAVAAATTGRLIDPATLMA